MNQQNISQSINPSQEIKKVHWQYGTHIEQVIIEIRKLAAGQNQSDAKPITPDDNVPSSEYSYLNLLIYDQDENAVVLNEDMDFNQVYKVRLVPNPNLSIVQNKNVVNNKNTINFYNQINLAQYMQNGNQNYAPSHNQSLLYSPSSIGGNLNTMQFKSANMGAQNNWIMQQQNQKQIQNQKVDAAGNLTRFNQMLQKNQWEEQEKTPAHQPRRAQNIDSGLKTPQHESKKMLQYQNWQQQDDFGDKREEMPSLTRSSQADKSYQSKQGQAQNLLLSYGPNHATNNKQNQQQLQPMPSFGPTAGKRFGKDPMNNNNSRVYQNNPNLQNQNPINDNVGGSGGTNNIRWNPGNANLNQQPRSNFTQEYYESAPASRFLKTSSNSTAMFKLSSNALAPQMKFPEQQNECDLSMSMIEEMNIRDKTMTYNQLNPFHFKKVVVEKTPQEDQFQNLYAQISARNQNIQKNQDKINQETQQRWYTGRNNNAQRSPNQNQQQQNYLRKDDASQNSKPGVSNEAKSIKINDNTLCGLSNINKDPDNLSLDEDEQIGDMGDHTPSNGFQDPSPPVKQEQAVVKLDDQPILTPGPMGSRNKVQANSSQRRHQTGNGVIFREVLPGEEQKQSNEIKRPVSQKGKRNKSLRIQDSLLKGVIDSGFKQGLNNLQKESAPNQPVADAEKQIDNGQLNEHDLKYSSPKNMEQRTPNVMPIKSSDDMKFVFDTYDSGKFYKNGEDILVKERIKMVEQQMDPETLAEQRRLEEEQAQKLLSLSPYTKNCRQLYKRNVSQPRQDSKSEEIKERRPTTPQPSVGVKVLGTKEHPQEDSKNKESSTPQSLERGKLDELPRSQKSPLVEIMNKMGIQMGINTGLNLNKMVYIKDKETRSEDRLERKQEIQKLENGNLKASKTPVLSKEKVQQDNQVLQNMITKDNRLVEETKDSGPNRSALGGSQAPLTPNQNPHTPILQQKHKKQTYAEQNPVTPIMTKKDYSLNSGEDQKKKFAIFRQKELDTSTITADKSIGGPSHSIAPSSWVTKDAFKTPTITKKKIENPNQIMPGFGDQNPKTPIQTRRGPGGQTANLNILEGLTESNFPGQEIEGDDSASYDMPVQSRRKQELSKSDISQISRITKPPTRGGADPKSSSGGWFGDDASELPRHYNTNTRKQETSYSDISQIDRSPFLKLKKPQGTMAGTPFAQNVLNNLNPTTPVPTKKDLDTSAIAMKVNNVYCRNKEETDSEDDDKSQINLYGNYVPKRSPGNFRRHNSARNHHVFDNGSFQLNKNAVVSIQSKASIPDDADKKSGQEREDQAEERKSQQKEQQSDSGSSQTAKAQVFYQGSFNLGKNAIVVFKNENKDDPASNQLQQSIIAALQKKSAEVRQIQEQQQNSQPRNSSAARNPSSQFSKKQVAEKEEAIEMEEEDDESDFDEEQKVDDNVEQVSRESKDK